MLIVKFLKLTSDLFKSVFSFKWEDNLKYNLCEPLCLLCEPLCSKPYVVSASLCVVIIPQRFRKYHKGSQRAYLYLILSRYLRGERYSMISTSSYSVPGTSPS